MPVAVELKGLLPGRGPGRGTWPRRAGAAGARGAAGPRAGRGARGPRRAGARLTGPAGTGPRAGLAGPRGTGPGRRLAGLSRRGLGRALVGLARAGLALVGPGLSGLRGLEGRGHRDGGRSAEPDSAAPPVSCLGRCRGACALPFMLAAASSVAAAATAARRRLAPAGRGAADLAGRPCAC